MMVSELSQERLVHILSYEPWDGMGYTARTDVATALMNLNPSIHTSVIFIIPYHTFIAVDDSNKL